LQSVRDRHIRVIIESLGSLWQADRIAAWERRGNDVAVACGRDICGGDQELARRVWLAHSQDFKDGEAVVAGGAEFHPLMTADQSLVGFVQLVRTPGTSQAEFHEIVEPLLSRLAQALASTEPDAPAGQAIPSRVRRHLTALGRRGLTAADLVTALNRCSWNIAELARRWDVSRASVHKWIRDAGLRRPAKGR
jgi:hypothetical protein